MMTAKQYAEATDEIRQLASELAASELKALRTYARAARTRRLQELLIRAEEDQKLGPQRLAAATAEAREHDRQKHARKNNNDHDAKQRKDETTQNRDHAPSARAAPAARAEGQEALSSCSTSPRRVEAFGPVRAAHSAAA